MEESSKKFDDNFAEFKNQLQEMVSDRLIIIITMLLELNKLKVPHMQARLQRVLPESWRSEEELWQR